jgi:hypothetical protein
MELDDDLLVAMQQAASDPARMLRGVPIWLPSDHRPPSPATPEQLRDAERRLGFGLPVAVRQVFSGVANGGFGPGYGLLGLGGGATDDLEATAVDSYVQRRSWNGQQGWYWPERLLPICHWGCAIYSCVSCERGGDLRVVRYDPNRGSWMQFRDEGRNFVQWLGAWLDDADLWTIEEPDGGEDSEVAGSLDQRLGQLYLFR